VWILQVFDVLFIFLLLIKGIGQFASFIHVILFVSCECAYSFRKTTGNDYVAISASAFAGALEQNTTLQSLRLSERADLVCVASRLNIFLQLCAWAIETAQSSPKLWKRTRRCSH
jgi:hypothetical protein